MGSNELTETQTPCHVSVAYMYYLLGSNGLTETQTPCHVSVACTICWALMG